MIYAMSDLHGCYDKYLKMLEKINFNDSDTLYILGDVVDRGDGGIKILQDMMMRKNVVAIKGNHDYMAWLMLRSIKNLGNDDRLSEMFGLWLSDGGISTYKAFVDLSDDEQKKILSYMNTFLIYDEVAVGGNNFFLSHTVPEKERMLQFEKLLWQEFIIGEPDYEKQYFDDKYIITGHTPTGLIDPNFTGKIYKANNHIAIDCGTVFEKPLGCICLDTLEEFYVE